MRMSSALLQLKINVFISIISLIRFYHFFSILFFVSIFISLVGLYLQSWNIQFDFKHFILFSAIFISPLTLLSHRSVTFLLHEVNSSFSGSFTVFFFSVFVIYMQLITIFYLFFLLGIITIVNFWSRNKSIIIIIVPTQ